MHVLFLPSYLQPNRSYYCYFHFESRFWNSRHPRIAKFTANKASMVDHAITKALTKSPIQEFLRDPSSGIPFLQKWFRNWLKLDITTLASILTLLGTIQSAFSSIQDWGVKLYWWLKKIFTSTISIAANDKLNRVVLEWLAQNVLEHRGTKILTAQTESNNPWDGYHPPAYKKPLVRASSLPSKSVGYISQC